jgi:hypothetical protein
VTEPFPIFTGNCPKNVSRDAKYGVRSGRKGPRIGLIYRTSTGEEWHATSEEHPALVEMVNEVKISMGDAPNGPFYINEFAQVIVPAGPDARYYLAGEYEGEMEFTFEGNLLSGRAVDLDGRALEPGEIWTGPHPGIPYVLRAGGGDIYYTSVPRENVTKKEWLSKHVAADAAKAFAARIQDVKGWAGGRFYVNEWQEMFAPLSTAEGLHYVYIGRLDLNKDRWFAKSSPVS